jgi:hypothetical protein
MSPRKKTVKEEDCCEEAESCCPRGDKGEEGPVGVDNSSGPAAYKRDKNGLLENVQYQFNEDGSINWRAMIKEEHLFPNKSWFEARKKPMPKTIEGLQDSQLLIKLSGIKELAKLRGFSSVSYFVEKCEHDHVAVSCSMRFTSNYETNNEQVHFQDMANATLNNTSNFATKFLETIACNRAFVRCVRNFLNVHIVGDDEIDKSDSRAAPIQNATSASSLSPTSILENTAAKELGCGTFKDFKESLRKFWADETYRNEDAANWGSYDDIPAKEARVLLKVIKS